MTRLIRALTTVAALLLILYVGYVALLDASGHG